MNVINSYLLEREKGETSITRKLRYFRRILRARGEKYRLPNVKSFQVTVRETSEDVANVYTKHKETDQSNRDRKDPNTQTANVH